MSTHNARFLRGIDKLNASTHKVVEKALRCTRQERLQRREYIIRRTKKVKV